MSRAPAEILALVMLATAARGQWTTNLWPTTNVYRFADVVTVTGISVLVFAETNVETSASGRSTNALSYFRDLDAQPWAGDTNGFERETNYYDLVQSGTNSNPDPFGDPVWVGRVWGRTSVTYRCWSTNTPPLKLQARELASWDVWRAMVERDAAVPPGELGMTSAAPRFYRVMRSNLVAQKEWIAARCSDFVIPGDFTNYFSGGGTTAGWPPTWTAAGLLASNALPPDYLTNTPWRALIGEGTNRYGYAGMQPCLTSLVWSASSVTWTNGAQRERQGYSWGTDLVGWYTNWTDAVLDVPPAPVVTDGDLAVPQRNASGSMADLLPFAYSAGSSWWKARADAATGLVCHADIYLQSAPGGRFSCTMVWDALGDEWSSGVAVTTNPAPAVVIVKAAESNMVLSAAIPTDTSLAEGTAPAEPDGGNPARSRGWSLNWSKMILRWDVEGGFKYR